MKKVMKAKSGSSLGMKSVKAGYDNNPGVTRADIISAAKMKDGKAKYGAKVAKKKVAAKKPMKKMMDGGDMNMSMAKKGASVKKAMGKCKMGC